jgi:hypothetical protein
MLSVVRASSVPYGCACVCAWSTDVTSDIRLRMRTIHPMRIGDGYVFLGRHYPVSKNYRIRDAPFVPLFQNKFGIIRNSSVLCTAVGENNTRKSLNKPRYSTLFAINFWARPKAATIGFTMTLMTKYTWRREGFVRIMRHATKEGSTLFICDDTAWTPIESEE